MTSRGRILIDLVLKSNCHNGNNKINTNLTTVCNDKRSNLKSEFGESLDIESEVNEVVQEKNLEPPTASELIDLGNNQPSTSTVDIHTTANRLEDETLICTRSSNKRNHGIYKKLHTGAENDSDESLGDLFSDGSSYDYSPTETDEIDHKFPEVGHSYLDSDRAFGRIEKRLRKHQNIYTPEEYRELIASSSRRNIVIVMEHHFRDTEDLPKKMKLINRKKDLLDEKVHFRDGIKWIRVDSFGSYLFKESYDYNTPFKMVFIYKHMKASPILAEDFSINRLIQNTGTLSKEKIENLKEQLCFVPEKNKWFYAAIIRSAENV